MTAKITKTRRFSATRISKRMARPVEKAILSTLSESRPGMHFDDLVDRVAKTLNPIKFPLRKTVSLYTRVVQLELERRGLIERVPGESPIRLRLPRMRERKLQSKS